LLLVYNLLTDSWRSSYVDSSS